MKNIDIDLYKFYSERMIKNGSVIVDPLTFYGLFRIMLACDAIHDFIGSRSNELRKEELKKIETAIKVSLDKDLKIVPDVDLKERCSNYITGIEPDKYFNSDKNAKKVVDSIMKNLGLEKISLSNVTEGDCSNDNSIIKSLDVLTEYENIGEKKEVEISVDMTTSTINLIPILSSVLNNERKLRNDCKGTKNLKLKYDLSSQFDAANVETIFKSFESSGLVKESSSPIRFNIRIKDYTLINCSLIKTNDIIELIVSKFFTSKPDQNGIIIYSNNETNNKKANNSVKGIIQNIDFSSNPFNIYKQLIPKTLGDFLQIITFLHSNNQKLFVTGDIICNSIASLFSKYCLGEIKNTDIPVLDGLGIYATDLESKTFAGVSVLTKMYKRKRTSFGKKELDVKNKLKLVGIKVTKILNGKRVKLTGKELQKKANSFKKLQIKAKNNGIKLKTAKGFFKPKEKLEKELKTRLLR